MDYFFKGMILLFFFLFSAYSVKIAQVTIHPIAPSFSGNCRMHGNYSVSRSTSDSIPMYLDERIKFTISATSDFGFGCGSCVLFFLEDDNDRFFLNKQLTRESLTFHHYQNKFIAVVIDIIPFSETSMILINTYLADAPIQNTYMVNYQEHACPHMVDEIVQFLFCTDTLCNRDSNLMWNDSMVFGDVFNPYYFTVSPRNMKFGFTNIQIVSYKHNYDNLQPIEWSMYLFPSFIKDNTFELVCTDRANAIFRFLFSMEEILESRLRPSYYGGILLSKHHLSE